MTKHEKVANIIAFLCILFGEDSHAFQTVMDFNPNYIIEKFERYVESMQVEYPWGLHPSLRYQRFHAYVDKWKLELQDIEDKEIPDKNCEHQSDGQLWKMFGINEEDGVLWFQCVKCEAFYKYTADKGCGEKSDT